MKIDGECLIELIGSCRNKVQVSRSVRMPQLRTLLSPSTKKFFFFLVEGYLPLFLLKATFHLTPIVMINGSSRRDLQS